MKDYLKWAVGLFAVIALVLGLDLLGLGWLDFIGPKRQDIRREIFEETKSFNEAKEQDLLRYRLQYLRAETQQEKDAIASTIRMAFADYDENKLAPELKSFLKSIKYGG